jgi:hypothetical protein
MVSDMAIGSEVFGRCVEEIDVYVGWNVEVSGFAVGKNS